MHRISRWRPRKKRRALSSRIQGSVTSNSTAAAFSNPSAQGKQQMNIGRPRASILKSVYMTNRTSRIPRPINREGLHCRSRPKKVTFGEIWVTRLYKWTCHIIWNVAWVWIILWPATLLPYCLCLPHVVCRAFEIAPRLASYHSAPVETAVLLFYVFIFVLYSC